MNEFEKTVARDKFQCVTNVKFRKACTITDKDVTVTEFVQYWSCMTSPKRREME